MNKYKRLATSDQRQILITAGPTREYIDPVRYISNDSSGKLGFALARAAARSGHKVILISGPVHQKTPKGVKRIDVLTAEEMEKAALKFAKKSDIIIMAAAVADFRPVRTARHKIKKSGALTLSLKKNPDILLRLGKNKGEGQILVGFALETESLKKRARLKLKNKNCDYIVANSAAAIGKNTSSAMIISARGEITRLKNLTKDKIADKIIRAVLQY